jgi:tripartite-type tricarboxylate transporter receptor subunit TctC
MHRHPSRLRRALLATCVAGVATRAFATEAFPSRLVRLVVPYPPGGTSSTIANLLSQQLQTAGIQLVIDYKPGAGGNIGVDNVLKSPADGYTIGFTAMNSFAINPHLTKKLPYDVVNDVQLITVIGGVPNIVVVNPELKATTLRELVALSRTSDLTYASPGAGTSPHLTGELLAGEAGLKMRHVPYRGEAPALQDVLGGRVPVMVANLTGLAEYVRGGKLRPIAVTSAARSAVLPQVPTVAESGVSGFDVRGYFVLFTPRGVPASALDKLNRELNKVITGTTFRDQMSKLGLEPAGTSVDAATQLAAAEHRRWGDVVRRTGATWD